MANYPDHIRASAPGLAKDAHENNGIVNNSFFQNNEVLLDIKQSS